MNENLRANWIVADAEYATAKRRFDEAITRRKTAAEEIDAFRLTHAETVKRREAEFAVAQTAIAAFRQDSALTKRQREAGYVETQREIKTHLESAEGALNKARRETYRLERLMREDSANEAVRRAKESEAA